MPEYRHFDKRWYYFLGQCRQIWSDSRPVSIPYVQVIREYLMGNNNFDVLLCHNSRDKSAVLEIALQLRRAGIKPWLDTWELRPGMPWQPSLENQISSIRAAAVFVGPNGIGPWQDLEIQGFLREFIKRRNPVIPVLLPGCPNKPQLPVFLEGMTWVDFRSSQREPLEHLIWGITGRRPVQTIGSEAVSRSKERFDDQVRTSSGKKPQGTSVRYISFSVIATIFLVTVAIVAFSYTDFWRAATKPDGSGGFFVAPELRQLIEEKFSELSSDSDAERDVYLSTFHFLDSVIKTELVSGEAEALSDAVESGVHDVIVMQPTGREIFWEQSGHLVPKNPKISEIVASVLYDPDLTSDEKGRALSEKLLEPYGVDVAFGGAVVDTGTLYQVNLWALSRAQEVVYPESLLFDGKGDLFSLGQDPPVLTDSSFEAVRLAAKRLAEKAIDSEFW